MDWNYTDAPDELFAFYLSILPKMRAFAKEQGYALAVHGSMARDLDLVAVPWRDDPPPVSPTLFVLGIGQCVTGLDVSNLWTIQKRAGNRTAFKFPVGRHAGIDLSFMGDVHEPTQEETP